MVGKIKSITAREIFLKHPEVKQKLWGVEFWSDVYFINTVGQKGNETWVTLVNKPSGTELFSWFSGDCNLDMVV